jgi:hypothetical protein
MTIQEQNTFLSKEYAEATRYMDNANETLQRANKEDGDRYYKDKKYVRTACGTAYLGVLIALDAWFVLKNVPEPKKKKQKSIEYYISNLSQIDKKMVSSMDTVYNVLHLEGYYRGERRIKVISEGFDAAYEIIEKIKPENPVEIAETGLEKVKHRLDRMFMFLTVFFRI